MSSQGAPPFRINARRFLLTYAQTTSTPQLLYDFLTSVRPVSKAIITRELHQDGAEHLHAAVEFSSRVNSIRVHIFDFAGTHPNISPARSWGACVNYCRKEGSVETAYFGCTAEDATVANNASASDGPSGAGAYDKCASCDTIREWYTYCIDEHIAFAFANAIWNQLHSAAPPTFFDNDVDGIISDPTLLNLGWVPEWHTLLLCGASGVGKTSWALANAPTPFLLVTDIDDLGFFDPAVHKSIVFDEVRCTGDVTGKGAWPLTSQIKLVTWDTPVSIRIRYKVAHIPKNVHKIFTSTDFFPVNGDSQIKRRVHAISLYDYPSSRVWI